MTSFSTFFGERGGEVSLMRQELDELLKGHASEQTESLNAYKEAFDKRKLHTPIDD